ncbi:hypothetical protein SAMN03080617_01772 [Algoriphagus alkaliphilus]|uniref:Alginate export n=1 Tax=Algoriphagus alkaliphilus TaxID=279824 RepID=A0A1G5XGR7_9BACT|nr:hypothetical protein SAMN03080617_01772 [Algoriphagus alkaliphilus]
MYFIKYFFKYISIFTYFYSTYFIFDEKTNLHHNQNRYLGSELDLVYFRTIAKNIKLNAGYSQFFETESMASVKGGIQPAKTQNWAWIQLIVTPNLFKHIWKEE